MHKIILLLSTVLILHSCGEQSNHSPSSHVQKVDGELVPYNQQESAPMSAIGTTTKRDDGNEPVFENRRLIWTADMKFKVKNVDASTNKISELSEQFDAQVSNMELKSYYYQVENHISIRVPNKQFHKLVSALKGQSIYMDRAKVSSDDVTEEFVDIESRLKTKREVRERYIEILRTRTGSLEDVFSAEESIRKLTEEIEAKEGRLRYLQNQVSFSTINLTIYHVISEKKEPVVKKESYTDDLAKSFGTGWSEVKGFLLALLSIWPLLLILTSLYFWKRKWIRQFIQTIRE